jgi:hypothetical protein
VVNCMSPLTCLFMTCPLLSIPCCKSKSITSCNSNFGEVLGYRQEGLSNVESESECTFGSDHIMECADAE